jgi:hypothetical protein
MPPQVHEHAAVGVFQVVGQGPKVVAGSQEAVQADQRRAALPHALVE